MRNTQDKQYFRVETIMWEDFKMLRELFGKMLTSLLVINVGLVVLLGIFGEYRMKIGIGYDGSMAIRDNTGDLKAYDCYEARQIRKAVYKWVQKKGEGVIL